MRRRKIALIGDYSEKVTAHRAIPKALEGARALTGAAVDWEWIQTRQIRDPAGDLKDFAGIWLVPATPYENTRGAIDAAQWAREGNHPMLGTCGGFQHMLIEFARNVAGIKDADHAEANPKGSALVVSRLSCSMVEVSGSVRFAPGSLLARTYGTTTANEGYHCNYGFNAAYRTAFESAGLRFTSWDEAGDVRGAELPSHPFFAGVLFQPERAALKGVAAPLVTAFVMAAALGA